MWQENTGLKEISCGKKLFSNILPSWGALFHNCLVAASNLNELKEILTRFKTHSGVTELLTKLDEEKSLPQLISIAIFGLAIKVFWPRIVQIQVRSIQYGFDFLFLS